MAARKHSKQPNGFVILELLLACTFIFLLANFAYTPASTFTAHYQKLQVRVAAQNLARDIRELQRQALFSAKSSGMLDVFANTEGYYITTDKGNIPVYFDKIGCQDVYFAQGLASTLRFSAIGSPTATGSFILKHRKNNNFSCRLTLQVASGRLDISETS